MSDLQYGHEYHDKEGREPRHIWFIVGEKGGVHIWATEKSKELSDRFGGRFYGGIECHWRQAQHGEAEVSHDHCWLLKGPCYHDGSSLYFSDHIEPMLDRINGAEVPEGVGEYLKAELFDWYRSKIDSTAEASQ